MAHRTDPPHPGTALPRREAGRRPGIHQPVWGRAEEVTGCLGGDEGREDPRGSMSAGGG